MMGTVWHLWMVKRFSSDRRVGGSIANLCALSVEVSSGKNIELEGVTKWYLSQWVRRTIDSRHQCMKDYAHG